jgi:hypothetical protein
MVSARNLIEGVGIHLKRNTGAELNGGMLVRLSYPRRNQKKKRNEL